MIINGKVINDSNGQPVPRATITLLNGNVQLMSAAADDNGNFSITTNQTADSLAITSIGYQGTYWPLPDYLTTTVFELPISTSVEDNIIIQYTPKKFSFLWWLLLGGITFYLHKKFE